MVLHQVMVFRRGSSIHPVNSIKHIIDSEGQLAGAVTASVPLVVAVPNVDTTTFKPGDVRVGAKVNGIFLSIFIIGATGAPLNGAINWYIGKQHTSQTLTNEAVPGNTGVSKIRNQIFHEEKGLAGSGDGTPMAFKGVIAIPRGMRRMREDDQIVVALNSQDATNNATFCVKAIYKSYF